MVLENKLGITSSADLARKEELLTKRRALELYDDGLIDDFGVGTFDALAKIHGHLFQDVYCFAGRMRDVNIAKGNFQFAPFVYLPATLETIEKMPQSTFDEIVEKYVEMNVAHPFREGNGRATRIWLDVILRKELGLVIDWSLIGKEDYLLAMGCSPVQDERIKAVLEKALTDRIADRRVYAKGIDASYRFEGFSAFSVDRLP